MFSRHTKNKTKTAHNNNSDKNVMLKQQKQDIITKAKHRQNHITNTIHSYKVKDPKGKNETKDNTSRCNRK
jgi:hypothetical protein